MSPRHVHPEDADRSANRPKPPDELFTELLRAARELLAIGNPLDAELIVSRMLGTWWGYRLPDSDVEELLGESLIDYAARLATPESVALLAGIAYLGTSRQSAKAESAALRLIEQGVARPSWAERVGAVKRGECYSSRDLYGDREEVVATFTYTGYGPHALVIVIDYNMGGLARDAWATTRVDELLDRCRGEAEASPLLEFTEIRPFQARALLERALRVADDSVNPPVSDGFASYHAFARARVHALPPGQHRPEPLHASDGWDQEARAMLAVEFLASDEAEVISDRSAAAHCADHIINYGCDHDYGRPLRVSPAKIETFLLDWVPRKVILTPQEQDAMPHVLAAWVRWASARTNLPDPGRAQTLDALWSHIGAFTESYRGPASYGLDATVVERLLPDGDLEALPRRAFAFPLLKGHHHGVDLETLDPADPADRRWLAQLEHDHTGECRADLHERVAELLWVGKPPELWSAAQRLLDHGYDRQQTLHRLMEVVAAYAEDMRTLRRKLDALPEG